MTEKSLKFVMILGAVLIAQACFVSPSMAVFYLANADMDATDVFGVNAGTNPLPHVTVIDANGKLFTNSVSGDITAGIGVKIHTVGVVEVTTARNGVNWTPLGGPGTNTDPIIMVFAVSGRVISLGANVFTAVYDIGRAGMLNPSSGYNAGNPDSWNFGSAIAPNTFAEWTLKRQESVTPDITDPDLAFQTTFLAKDVNTSSVDSRVGQQAQGRFLFREDSDNSPAAPLNPGDDFLVVKPNVNVDPLDEGIFTTLGQVIEQVTVATSGITASDLAVLNAIAAWAGLPDLDADTFGDFATGLVDGRPGSYTDWFPAFGEYGLAANQVTSGDFRGNLTGVAIHPGYQIVPEPASLAIWSLGLLGFGMFASRRRRKTA
jgi:hypothetical protein